MCRGGFSRGARCNFNPVRLAAEGGTGTTPKSAPTRRCWASPHEDWDLGGSTPALGRAGAGGCGKGELLVLLVRC